MNFNMMYKEKTRTNRLRKSVACGLIVTVLGLLAFGDTAEDIIKNSRIQGGPVVYLDCGDGQIALLTKLISLIKEYK